MTYDDERRRSFDANAALYDAARPSYPGELIDRILARARANDALEIGGGTGQATRLFRARGVAVTALEPGPNLAALLRRNVPDVTIVESTFEDLAEDRQFDLIYAAQSIHWVDPAVRYPKIARLLRSGGHVAVIRNEKDELEPALRAEFDAAYENRLPPRDRQALDSADRARVFHAEDITRSGLFGPVELVEVKWSARYTTRAYLDLLATYSDHALLADDVRAALLADIVALIGRRGGAIDVPYVSLAFVARR
jgi:SAM-dependent methyltransferase